MYIFNPNLIVYKDQEVSFSLAYKQTPYRSSTGMMNNNNMSLLQVDESVVIDAATGHDAAGSDATGWKSQLQPDSRRRIIIKIMDTLKRHLPFSGQEGLQELEKIAVRFEGKIYDASTSQSDYLRKISLKMLTMETRNPNAMHSANNGLNPPNPDFATELDDGEVCNPGPITPVQFL